jgi:hypothetical protein
MVELYKNKKLINDLALLREYLGRIEWDVKQTLSDIEKQDILLEDIQETYFDKPLQLEIQKELEEQIKKHQEEEQQQKDFKDIIE